LRTHFAQAVIESGSGHRSHGNESESLRIVSGHGQKLNRGGKSSGSSLYPDVSECAGSEALVQANRAAREGQHMKSAFKFFTADGNNCLLIIRYNKPG